jgi:uncharacterized protein
MKRIGIVLAVLVFGGGWLVRPLSAADARPDKDEKKERTLTVQGQGKASAIPDIATLTVEVSREGTDLDPVLTQVRRDMNKVLEAVKGQAIEDKDVRTEMFNVRPKYEQDKRGNPHPVGYAVTNRVWVKVRDLKKTGKVLSAVLNAGATSVNGPNFELDKPESVELQALASAAKEARTKAETLAEAAGVKLGEILTINPQPVNGPMPRRPMMMRAMAMPAAEPEEPIAAGEQTLTASVTITFAIH